MTSRAMEVEARAMNALMSQSEGEEDQGPDEHEDEDTKPNSRLLVTHEGALDPALLLRTEGYINKKGGAVNARGGFRNWKKRWFMLHEVDFMGFDGFELQYFDSPNGTMKGRVGLSEVEIVSDEVISRKGKHDFQIKLQNGSVLQLNCDNAEEKEEWLETLQMVVAYMTKVMTSTAMTLDGYDPLQEDDEENYRIGEEIAQNSQAFGHGLFGSEAGKPAQFAVQIHDLIGQQVTRGGMPITATITNEECLYHLRVHDEDDGTYLAHYTLGKSGNYQLSILLNDEHHIFGSPFDIQILPARTVPAKCSAVGQALSTVTAGVTHNFTIQAFDGYGNKKVRGGDPFEVGVMGPAQLKSLRDCGNGSYICEIIASSPSNINYVAASSLMLLITLHGKHISGSPFKPVIIEQLKPIVGDQSVSESLGFASPYGSNYSHSTPYQSVKTETKASTSLVAEVLPLDLPSEGIPDVVSSAQSLASSRGLKTPTLLKSDATSISIASTAQQSPQQNVNAFNSQSSNASKPSNSAAISVDSGAPLSRLEKARQKALLAKSEGANSVTDNRLTSIPTSSTYKDDGSAMHSVGSARSTKPMNISIESGSSSPTPTGNDRLSQLAARNMRTLNSLKQQHSFNHNESQGTAGGKSNSGALSPDSNVIPLVSQLGSPSQTSPIGMRTMLSPPKPGDSHSAIPSTELGGIVSGLRLGLGGGANLSAPTGATKEERSIWDQTHSAFTSNPEAMAILTQNLDMLYQVFQVFCESIEGVAVVKLTNSRNGGLYRLLELYDVLPTCVSKMEAKVLFSLILNAQRNLKSAASIVGGGIGIDFVSFVKYLVMVSHHALSKTNSFSTLYSTMQAKIQVMLFKWGFADAIKLQMSRSAQSQLPQQR